MGHKFTAKVPYQRITPPEIFFNRRKFLSAFGLGILAAPMATCSSAGAAQRPQDSLIDLSLIHISEPMRRRGIGECGVCG